MHHLTPAERRALRALAHHLQPVVMIGEAGLTPAMIREIDVCLKSHELIKVRVLGDDRERRVSLIGEICASLDARPVQHIGKILVIFRPRPEQDESSRPRPKRKERRCTKRSYQNQ